jgi:hypothetical protein
MLTEAPHQPPRYRNILIGAICFGLLLVLIWQLSAVTKYLGHSLLYLPAQLGVIRQVTLQEVQPVQAPGWTTITVSDPGPYHVYIDAFDILAQTDADMAGGREPWLLIQGLPSHEPLAVEYVLRGLALYDTPFAAGRPTFAVDITRPGEYRVSARSATALWLVPDYTTGQERRITLAITVELAVLLVAGALIWYWRRRRHYAARRVQIQQQDRRRSDAAAFWQRENERGTKSDE